MENSVVETRTVKIGGREFTLAFTLKAMLEMQKSIEGFNFNDIRKIVADTENMLEILYILAVNGGKLMGQPVDVDKEWLALHIPVTLRKLVSIRIAIMDAMAAGMMMETEDDNNSKEVDLVLQEIQKKREQTSSPGEK